MIDSADNITLPDVLNDMPVGERNLTEYFDVC